MLKVEDLWFSYGSKCVLKGVNFEHRNGVGCILGPNGAGKTTLLKCVCGILAPLRGKVSLNNIDILKLSFRDRAKIISYVPQEFNITFPYRVLEVVLMGRNPRINPLIGPRPEDEEVALKALELVGLKHLSERPFTNLSGGEKRLALIARALAQESKLMLLDEPTSFLDFKNKHLVLSLIRRIAHERRRLVLLTLHDPNLAYMYCDQVFLMKDGIVVDSGEPRAVITEEKISSIYDVDVKAMEIDGFRLILPRYNSFAKTLKLDACCMEVSMNDHRLCGD